MEKSVLPFVTVTLAKVSSHVLKMPGSRMKEQMFILYTCPGLFLNCPNICLLSSVNLSLFSSLVNTFLNDRALSISSEHGHLQSGKVKLWSY